jgi:hypothetical protein
VRPQPPQGCALSPELRAPFSHSTSVPSGHARSARVECDEHGAVTDGAAHVAEGRRAALGHARDARQSADLALAVEQGRRQCRHLLEVQLAQLPVGVAAVREAHDRLLADVAALREGDRPLDDSRLGGEARAVEVDAEARDAALDAQRLPRLCADRDCALGERRVPGRARGLGRGQQKRAEWAGVPAVSGRGERPLEQRALPVTTAMSTREARR